MRTAIYTRRSPFSTLHAFLRAKIVLRAIALLTFLTVLTVSLWKPQPSAAQLPENLPPARSHPLPPALLQWQSPANSGDYFSEITATPVGHLVWSRFPVRVYVDPATSGSGDRSQVWVDAVQQAIDEWSIYLPLAAVPSPDGADITILRQRPALRRDSGGQFRARNAEARYTIHIDRAPSRSPVLSHRFTIQLRPDLSAAQLQATARHELGHALGIWGHSPSPTDALFFSPVRLPPVISPRDVNTLKRIYEQPTRLGWAIEG